MSSAISSSSSDDHAQRWELARLLTKDSITPRKVLDASCFSILRKLEESEGRKIDLYQKLKIRDLFFSSNLNKLKELLISEICVKILFPFDTMAINEILVQFLEDCTLHPKHMHKFNELYLMHKVGIGEILEKKATELSSGSNIISNLFFGLWENRPCPKTLPAKPCEEYDL